MSPTALRALALFAALALQGCFRCTGEPGPACAISDPADPACATVCCEDRGQCAGPGPTCAWNGGEPCAADAECLSGRCVDGTCAFACAGGEPCGLDCCDSGDECIDGACQLPPPPPVTTCAPLAPGAPPAPGDVGDCCDTRWPMQGGPCIGGLTCFNGWCTRVGCASDAECDGAVAETDRSPFPAGTTFACLTAGSGALSYCAPTGSSVRVCGDGAAACTAAEACVPALSPDDPITRFTGVCETAFEDGAPAGSACYVPSMRSCSTDADCRAGASSATPLETCDPTGTCVLAYPASRYQCRSGAGAFEVAPCGMAASCDGPGGIFQGGCLAGFLAEAGACTEACSTAAQNCPAGTECSDLYGLGTGVCTGVECGRSEAPVDTANPVLGAGLATAAVPCATPTDCTNGGLAGARCLGGFCEHTDRYVACPSGSYCSVVLAGDEFPQGVPPMDALGRVEVDTVLLHCVPAVPGASLGVGDPCTDSADCASGLCDVDALGSDMPDGRCTNACATDADCPAPLHCIDFGLGLGAGTAPRLALCLDVAVFGLQTCTAEAPCPGMLGCAPWSTRASVGVCFTQAGVVEGFVDDLTVGSSCDPDLNRCLPGPDGVSDSTADAAAAAACIGDDELAVGSNPCRSLRCFDADDLDGGAGAATHVNAACSAVCRTNADCDVWSRCRSVLQNDNSTDTPGDDTWLGLCVTFRPAAATDCLADPLACDPRACDDGGGITEPGAGECYTPGAAVGAPCTSSADCVAGGRCLAGLAPGAASACTVDGCAFDPDSGYGDGADCPGGTAAAACWSAHRDAGLCLAHCDPAAPACPAGWACSTLPGAIGWLCVP